jgi:SAM-dependent methyltransferase
VRRRGLMPALFRLRMWLSPIVPRTLLHNVRHRLRRPSGLLPIPSLRARYLVAGSADAEGFLELGRRGARSIEDVLARHGFALRDLEALLDFGCGCGRVLRHWRGLEGVAVHGTEMSAYLAEECRRCVPFATVGVNRAAPPLGYADASFDLVYALSVFTHLHEDLQKAWRDELRRVLKPGGLLLITTHGEHYLARLAEKERRAFRAGRCVVHGAEFLGENLCTTYHPESYVRESLARGFSVLDFLPEGAEGNPRQDLYLMQRLD